MVKTEGKTTTVTTFFQFKNETPGALRYFETDKDGNVKKGDTGGAIIDTLYLRKAGMSGKVMKKFQCVITELPD